RVAEFLRWCTTFGECEKLASKCRRILARLFNPSDQLGALAVDAHACTQHGSARKDHSEHVVKVVSDSASQYSQAFYPLSVLDLSLHATLHGHVPIHEHRALTLSVRVDEGSGAVGQHMFGPVLQTNQYVADHVFRLDPCIGFRVVEREDVVDLGALN